MTAETETGWPYDADQHDPLTKLRIPVTSFNPQWMYLVCFDRDSEARPTDIEARILASYIDYMASQWLSRQRLMRRTDWQLDTDAGHNTTVLHKRGPDEWAYRQPTWRVGEFMWPPASHRPHHQKLSLAELLDHKHSSGGRMTESWRQWKADHADLFGGVR